MKGIKKSDKNLKLSDSNLVQSRSGGDIWTYIKIILETVREPILILDDTLRVMAANEPFYRTFQVEKEDTEGKIIYELGNGQWDIAPLKKLLENILPKNTFFKGFEVIHEFPVIGRKAMLLNAREIPGLENKDLDPCRSIILVAIEDMTEILVIAETLAGHSRQIDTKQVEQSEKLEKHIIKLEKEISMLKTRS